MNPREEEECEWLAEWEELRGRGEEEARCGGGVVSNTTPGGGRRPVSCTWDPAHRGFPSTSGLWAIGSR